MKMMCLKQSLLQLRELITSGAETLITLEALDRLIQRYAVHTQYETTTTHHTHLLDELKKVKKKLKELQAQNSCLEETVANLKTDLDMVDIRIEDLEKENKKLRQRELKEEGREKKKNLKKTQETEIQCDSLSAQFVDQLVLMVQQYKRKNDELKTQLKQMEQNAYESLSVASTAEGTDQTKDEMSGELENPEELLTPASSQKGTPFGDQNAPQDIFGWLKTKTCQFFQTLQSQ